MGDRDTAVPAQATKAGTVVDIYEFAGERRYIVGFDDGTDAVFFNFELRPE